MKQYYLIPYPLDIASEHQHAFAISSALAAFGQPKRGTIGLAVSFSDPNTADLFTEVSCGIDRPLWFVESHFSQGMRLFTVLR